MNCGPAYFCMKNIQRCWYFSCKESIFLQVGLVVWLCFKISRIQMYLIVDIFYLPAGVCYGFQVMDNAESPDIPFTVMLTRFSIGMSKKN